MIELLAVITIIMLLVGMASYGYTSYANAVAVETGASTVEAQLRSARQAAIASGKARRLVLDLANERLWVEGKRYEQFDFSQPVGNQGAQTLYNHVRMTDPVQLGKNVDIVDVSGWTVRDIDEDAKYYYVEFNRQGRMVQAYRNGESGDLDEQIAIHVARRRARVVLPDEINMSLFESDEMKREALGIVQEMRGRVLSPELADSPLWDADAGTSRLDDDDMKGRYTDQQLQDRQSPTYVPDAAAIRVGAAQLARKQVHTIIMLEVTGLSRTFPYGLEFPWSDQELAEAS